MRRSPALLAVAASCVALVACGSDDEPQPAAQNVLTQAAATPVETVSTIADTPEPEAPEQDRKTEKQRPADEPASSADPAATPAPSAEAPKTATSYGPREIKPAKANTSERDRRQITSRITTYLQAIAASNGSRACEQMTAAGQQGMTARIADIAPETRGAPCAEAIVLYQGAYGDAIERPSVTRVRVDGSRATAVGPLKQVARLERQRGRWLIAEYGH